MTETTIKSTAKKPTLHERLAVIQKELKAPKNQFNKFANFYYRSCEDILEAVKPLLGDLTLIVSDEIVMIGDRYYVRATVELIGSDKGEVAVSTAYAREADTKAGMDVAQITGAASSYARKYALNELFLIDDTKDADNDDNTVKATPTKTVAKPVYSTVQAPASHPKEEEDKHVNPLGLEEPKKEVSPSLRQIEAVVKIAKQNGEELAFDEVRKWTPSQASDYISKRGNGGYYKNKETR